MAINSVDDARTYLDAVNVHLNQLIHLSSDAGLHGQAAIWCALAAAFAKGPDEVQHFEDFVGQYLKESIDRYMPKTENPFSNLEESQEC